MDDYGSNFPTDADPLLDRLRDQYASLRARADELEAAIARVPEVLDERSIDRATGFIKQLRECANDAEAKRKAEKSDFMVAGRKVDDFFKALKERLEAASDAVEDRVRDYLKAADLPRIRGGLGGTATLMASIEFEILDPIKAAYSVAPYFDDEALAKAIRGYQRAAKGEAWKRAMIEKQPLPGIRFYESFKARVA